MEFDDYSDNMSGHLCAGLFFTPSGRFQKLAKTMKMIIKPPKSREDRRLEAMQREFDKQDKIDHAEWLKILAKITRAMKGL